MERHHLGVHQLAVRPDQSAVVHVDGHRQREDVRVARHTHDDVAEEDLECARHARGAEVPHDVQEQPLGVRMVVHVEPVQEVGPDVRVQGQHRERVLDVGHAHEVVGAEPLRDLVVGVERVPQEAEVTRGIEPRAGMVGSWAKDAPLERLLDRPHREDEGVCEVGPHLSGKLRGPRAEGQGLAPRDALHDRLPYWYACRLRGLVVGEPAVAHARQPHNVHARREAVPQPASHEARRRVLHMAVRHRAPHRVHEVVVLDRAPGQSTGIGRLHPRAHGGDQAEPRRLTARRGHRSGWGCRSYGDHGQECPPS